MFGHLGFIAFLNSELGAARAYFEEFLALAREVGDKMGIGWPLWWLAYIYFYQGEYLRGLSLAEEGLAFFQEAGNAGAVAQTLGLLAEIHFYSQDNVVKAQARVEEFLALAREMNDTGYEVGALDLLGRMALHQGKTVLARSLFAEIQAVRKEERDNASMGHKAAYLAQVEAREGDYAAARAHYEESLAFLKNGYDKWNIAFSLEGLANVVAAQGEVVWAARLWGEAESLRIAMGTPIPLVYQADYERSVAAACAQLGKAAFTTAWAEGGGMMPEHVLAEREPMPEPTSALTAPSSAAAGPPSHAGLTPREMDVLVLLAQGLTSAQIAEQLIIGVVTVNFHVRSIYSKLGVTSRSAATRYAMEHHLL